MKIGVISDTHDNLEMIKRAVDLFNSEGVELVIHAGDFVSPFTEKPFRALNAKFVGIFGNNDGDKLLLREKYRGVGELSEEPLVLEMNARKIVVTHKPKIVEALVASRIYDVVIFGHTHKAEVRKVKEEKSEGSGGKKGKEVLVLNPGECCGYLTGRKTVAILDLETLSARIEEI